MPLLAPPAAAISSGGTARERGKRENGHARTEGPPSLRRPSRRRGPLALGGGDRPGGGPAGGGRAGGRAAGLGGERLRRDRHHRRGQLPARGGGGSDDRH